MRLGEKFTLADPAMAALQVETEAHFLPLGIMIADLCRHRGDILQLPEIQRFTPDKGCNRLHEIGAQRPVAGAYPCADEGSLFPRQCARFIIANGRFDGQDDGANLRRGA